MLRVGGLKLHRIGHELVVTVFLALPEDADLYSQPFSGSSGYVIQIPPVDLLRLSISFTMASPNCYAGVLLYGGSTYKGMAMHSAGISGARARERDVEHASVTSLPCEPAGSNSGG